jgi:hypothetical protein
VTLKLNRTPAYFLAIPLIACAGRFFVAAPFSDSSRDIAIDRGQALIMAIEEYYSDTGSYPEELKELVPVFIKEIPDPGIMGIRTFDYQRTADAYHLSFTQWVQMGSAQEVVRYDKEELHAIKGAFANFDTAHEHWRYYWLD